VTVIELVVDAGYLGNPVMIEPEKDRTKVLKSDLKKATV
jgi:hypothetical protein